MMKKVLLILMVAALATAVQAATIAHWDFEDGVTGQPFTPEGDPSGSGGSADLVAGYVAHGWDSYWGPGWATGSPGGIGSLVMNNADNHQDGYTLDAALQVWSPEQWTIECQFMLQEKSGWETLIGRDGSTQSEPEADFYLQNNGIDDMFRVNFDTVGGQRWVLDGNVNPNLNRWYALAVMSDGVTLSMWLDDSTGYQMIGSLDISAQTVAQNALAASDKNWTFGRGWYNGGFVDHIDGQMDNIRFSDVALAPEDLIALAIPEPATLALLGLGGLLIRRKK